ncbi:MAG TPA: OmpA family protein [Kofleriaceae bacterium]
MSGRTLAIALVAALCAPAAADPPCRDVTAALDANVAFQPGRTRLDDKAKLALKPLVDALQTHGKLRLAITAYYAQELGPDALAKARLRVAVVKWFLVDRGIEAGRIVTRTANATRGKPIELAVVPDATVACAPRPPPGDDASALSGVVATKLHFDPGLARLDVTAKTALRPLVNAMHSRPGVRIVVVGHVAADVRSKTEATAKRRAEAVKWYLVDQGVETERIATRISKIVMEPVIELEIADGRAMAPQPAAAVKPPPARVMMPPASSHDRPAEIGGSATPMTIAEPATVRPPLRPDLVRRTSYKPMFDDRPLPVPDPIIRRIDILYQSGLARCYRKAQRDNPGLAGKVSLTFTIDADGRVLDPAAEGVDDDLDTCIRDRMGYWQFPPNLDPARFTMSLALQP